MTIFRVHRTDSTFFQASKEPFEDVRLSWGARGVMGYLLTKPDGWTVRNSDLLKRSPAGRKKLSSLLKELRLFGYMRRHRIRNEYGKFEWVTEIYESPSDNPDFTIPPKRGYGCPKSATIPPLSVDGSPVDGKGGHIVIISNSNNKGSKSGSDAPIAHTFDFDSFEEVPRNLDTEEFRAAARRWVAHVASLPKQTVTPSRITAWLARCSKFGADVAIQVIDFAISGGKHDLYPDAFERFSDKSRQAEQQTDHHPLFEQLVSVYDGTLSPDSLSPDILRAIEATGYDLNQVRGMARDWFMGAYRLIIMEYLNNE